MLVVPKATMPSDLPVANRRLIFLLTTPTITPTLRQRFSATHEIDYVASVAKNPDDYPEISFLSAEDQEKAVNEFRPEQGWLVMRVKTSPSSTS